MGSTFNPQILVEKLAKLNNSQQSIGTLSHWCIFHMNKAKQVVETWDRQFHCSPRDQRLAYLYLANDILQNSRRKGSEYVGEFWRVLPEAFRDVIESGDEFGKSAALRLISIWDERKVFGSRGHILKDEFVGKQMDNGSGEGKLAGSKLRHGAGNTVDRIVSSFQVLYGGQMDEDSSLIKCRDAMSYIEKAEKEIMSELGSGQLNGTGFVDELKSQHTLLNDSIQQLTTIESSRSNLINILRESLREQELKLDQVHNQLQAAHVLSEQADNMCRALMISNNGEIPPENIRKEIHVSRGPHDFVSENKEQLAPVTYAARHQVSFSGNPDDPKATAAAVAAKLTASSSSAEMLTYVLSSLASGGMIGGGGGLKESSSGEFPSEKRVKIEDDHHLHHHHHPSYAPSETTSSNPTLEMNSYEKPPPPSSPPPMPPLPPMQPYPVPEYIPAAGPTIADGSYGYGGTIRQMAVPIPIPGYSPVASYSGLGNTVFYQSYAGDGVFYGQQQPPSSQSSMTRM